MHPSLSHSVFFFSSRRRHTRLQGDWSSDVCSSDLLPLARLDRSSRSHADRIARPDAVEAGFEYIVLQHQIEAIEANIGAKRALENDEIGRASCRERV